MTDIPAYVDHYDERFSLPFTYGGLLPEDSAFERAQVVMLPIPYEQTTTYGTGTKEGPQALIAASRHMELYDEELDYEVYQVGLHTLRELEPIASGPKAMLDRITEVTRELLAHGKFVVGLGGEHTISFGLVRAYAERFPGLSVLQFDAHADLRDAYQGTPYNHASVLRRISEIVPSVQVGIRSLSREEAAWVKARETRLFYASEVVGSLSIASEISAALTDQVYITICLDGLDPSASMSWNCSPSQGILRRISWLPSSSTRCWAIALNWGNPVRDRDSCARTGVSPTIVTANHSVRGKPPWSSVDYGACSRATSVSIWEPPIRWSTSRGVGSFCVSRPW
jgi:agmatinase